MNTITMANLEGAIKRLNALVGIDKPNGRTVGEYVLDGAYGGWKLTRLVSVGGGQSDISCGGFVSKRELWNQIQAIIAFNYANKETVSA